jgi:hypothetical protein
MIRIKKKIIKTIVLVAVALFIMNIALNFKEYSFKFRLLLNWNCKILPAKINILYSENNFGGLDNDGSEYTVMEYRGNYDLSDIKIDDTYTSNGHAFRVIKSDALSENRFYYIENELKTLDIIDDPTDVYLKFGNIPEEFVLNKDDISYCIEIDRRLDKEAQNKPSTNNIGYDRLYIMQDKTHNLIYILESTI